MEITAMTPDERARFDAAEAEEEARLQLAKLVYAARETLAVLLHAAGSFLAHPLDEVCVPLSLAAWPRSTHDLTSVISQVCRIASAPAVGYSPPLERFRIKSIARIVQCEECTDNVILLVAPSDRVVVIDRLGHTTHGRFHHGVKLVPQIP